MDFRASLAILLLSATLAGAQDYPPPRKEFPPIHRLNPNYPIQAEREGLAGRVVARVHVAPNGKVTQVQVVTSTHKMFDREVIRVLATWTYKPETYGFVSEYELVFDPNNIDRSPAPQKIQRPPSLVREGEAEAYAPHRVAHSCVACQATSRAMAVAPVASPTGTGRPVIAE